jgi:hypothetical protein
MTEEEAIAVADAYVRSHGGTLAPEISATRKKRWFRTRYYWWVVTNIPRKGGNWFIEIDDVSGTVSSADFTKRKGRSGSFSASA